MLYASIVTNHTLFTYNTLYTFKYNDLTILLWCCWSDNIISYCVLLIGRLFIVSYVPLIQCDIVTWCPYGYIMWRLWKMNSNCWFQRANNATYYIYILLIGYPRERWHIIILYIYSIHFIPVWEAYNIHNIGGA